MSKKDDLFLDPNHNIAPFQFDQTVADAFDNMIERSVPFYHELQTMVLRLVQTYSAPEHHILDLGCSTGTSIANIVQTLPDTALQFTGIDNSPPMLEKAKKRLSKLNTHHPITWKEHDLNTPIQLPNHHICLLILTLQFIKKEQRPKLLHEIYSTLNPGGALILVEKLHITPPKLQDLYNKFYYGFKKDQGYANIEIEQKRRALETVLQPLTLDENTTLLKNAGFKTQDIFFKWFNFVGILVTR